MSKYKLVPVEPTPEMLAAGKCALDAGCYVSGIYADMLTAAPAVQGEPVGWQFYQDGKWWYGDDRIKDHRKNTEEAGYPTRNVYAASPVEPEVRKLGITGAAFDPPSVRRAYTYSDQPNNTTAWKLGRAACKERSGGDLIDYGLQMLQYLQDEGFGVFEIDEADPAPQPAEQQPAPAVQREPMAWVTADTVDGQAVNGKPRRVWWENNEGVGMPIYAASQPAEQPQLPLPDFITDPDDSDEGASLWDHGFKQGWNSCLEAVAEDMQHTE